MSREEIFNEVVEIIVDKLGVEESQVTESASFANDLGADSLDTVDLIMEFEHKFDCKIPDEVASSVTTVGGAVDAIYNFVSQKS